MVVFPPALPLTPVPLELEAADAPPAPIVMVSTWSFERYTSDSAKAPPPPPDDDPPVVVVKIAPPEPPAPSADKRYQPEAGIV